MNQTGSINNTNKLSGYKLHKAWFSFAINNPEQVTPMQGVLYLYCVELCNSLGWPKTFGLPAAIAMAATGIKSYNTYAKAFKELIKIGAIRLISKSQNQYSANIIALSDFNGAIDIATDSAVIKAHREAPYCANETYKNKQQQAMKPINNDIEMPIYSHCFEKPSFEEVEAYCQERANDVDPQAWLDFYTSNGWRVGRNPMKDWQAAVRTWERNGIKGGSKPASGHDPNRGLSRGGWGTDTIELDEHERKSKYTGTL